MNLDNSTAATASPSIVPALEEGKEYSTQDIMIHLMAISPMLQNLSKLDPILSKLEKLDAIEDKLNNTVKEVTEIKEEMKDLKTRMSAMEKREKETKAQGNQALKKLEIKQINNEDEDAIFTPKWTFPT